MNFLHKFTKEKSPPPADATTPLLEISDQPKGVKQTPVRNANKEDEVVAIANDYLSKHKATVEYEQLLCILVTMHRSSVAREERMEKKIRGLTDQVEELEHEVADLNVKYLNISRNTAMMDKKMEKMNEKMDTIKSPRSPVPPLALHTLSDVGRTSSSSGEKLRAKSARDIPTERKRGGSMICRVKTARKRTGSNASNKNFNEE